MNDGDTPTRFIYKIGYGAKSEWANKKQRPKTNYISTTTNLYTSYPIGNNKKNFISVSINVKFLKTETPQESTNVEFCFSVSIGIPIDVSYENSFRGGCAFGDKRK